MNELTGSLSPWSTRPHWFGNPSTSEQIKTMSGLNRCLEYTAFRGVVERDLWGARCRARSGQASLGGDRPLSEEAGGAAS